MARTWLIRCRDWIVGEASELVVLGAVAVKLLCGDPAEPGHLGHARHAARAGQVAHAGHAAQAGHARADARVAQPAEARAPRVATRPYGGRPDAAGTVADVVARAARVVADCPSAQARAQAADVRAGARTARARLVVVTLRTAPTAGARPFPARAHRTVPAPRFVARMAAERAAVPAPAHHAT